jgi:lytic murein transglycosylase
MFSRRPRHATLFPSAAARRSLAVGAMLIVLSGIGGCAGERNMGFHHETFDTFYERFRSQVAEAGLDPAELDASFRGEPAPVPGVLDAEQNQPEVKQTFQGYLRIMLSDTRRAKGEAMLHQYQGELGAVSARTGVPPEVIVALWGIESNYGAGQGDYPTVPALATLAWASPRGDFFGREALNALRLARQQGVPAASLTGSWAGAMGGCQFMPGTYLKYAMDGDGDGKADIWSDPVDVFASTANYLSHLGWKPHTPWRISARVTAPLPPEAKLNERGLSAKQTIAQWQKWGVVTAGQSFTAFGPLSTSVRIYQPLGAGGPTYMLGPNVDAILGWNNSSYFAASVFLLSEAIKTGQLPDVE